MPRRQNIENQPQPVRPQGEGMPLMPPPPPPMPRQGWRGRWLQRMGNLKARPLTLQQERTIPNWLIGRSVLVFFIALIACWVAFGYVPRLDLIMVSCLSVILFFMLGAFLSRSWSHVGEKRFLKNVFWIGVLVRLIFVLYMFFLFNPSYYGNTFGDEADTSWYMPFGAGIAQWIRNGFDMTFAELQKTWGASIDDTGYPMWLGVVYLLTGGISDVFIPFVFKSIMGAYCAICIYRVAHRHFGEGTARTATLFVALNPNMIYWCGTMMKETEMVFLVCLAIDNFDKVLSSGQKYTFKSLLPGMLAALALMFFRTVLGLVMFIAMFAHIVLASQRVMSMGKKFLAGVLVALVLVVSMGDRIRSQSQKLMETAQSDSQQMNINWRSHSNSLAQYASAAVFAPLIFTIPFPTMNQANEVQLLQVQLSGGSYIKNIMSFFVILVMFIMLLNGDWRKHVFIIAYTVGYLIVLVMSAFAQSGRFHMPIMPVLMLFAAYGVQLEKTNPKIRKWFSIVLAIEVLVCLAWNWFKLRGRGMI